MCEKVTSYRVLERGYISDVDVYKNVCKNIRNIPRRGVIKKFLFLMFGLNIFRVCLLYVLGCENNKTLDKLAVSAVLRRKE